LRAVAWRVTIRSGSKVDRLRFESLGEALDVVERRCREVEAKPPRRMVRVPMRSFTPAEQVAARAEVAGPGRLFPSVRGGVDVRGDGSTEAWTGRTSRDLIDLQEGEDAYAALRRSLAPTASSVSVDP
jgi:hypothetical protein